MPAPADRTLDAPPVTVVDASVSGWATVSDDPTATSPEAAVPPDASEGVDAPGLTDIVGGVLVQTGTTRMHGGGVDSRRLQPGQTFFALPGERVDGHDFLAEAVAAGAAGLVVGRSLAPHELADLRSTSIVRVDDVAAALRTLAAAHRDRFDPLVVGITGSIAKTSTKEQTAELLSERFEVLRNVGNENNEIGLPLTLLRLTAEHEIAVLEMGLYTTGEIALLAGIARPTVGVVTAVRGVHLSRAGTIEAIEHGKRELVEALPASGTAILNADDPRVAGMAGHTRATVMTYGFDTHADVHARDVVSEGEAGMRFDLHLPAATVAVRTPVLGRHGVHNALAAVAVALTAGMSHDAIVAGLKREVRAPHRSQLVRAGEWTILDDTYNASPDAVMAALDLLGELPGRRVAVLGEMLELGDDAADAHLRVGRHVPGTAEKLVVVGAGASGIAEGAMEAGLPEDDVERVSGRDAALELLLAELRPGDRVLIKASRGEALDLLVDRLRLAAAAGSAEA